MNYYQEVTLLPDVDISLSFLWFKVYKQLHFALVNQSENGKSHVGISFPTWGGKGFPLGNNFRLFARSKEELQKCNLEQYLNGLNDYVHVKSIKQTPPVTKFCSFVRVHVKGEARIESDMLAKAKIWSEKSGKTIEECLIDLEKTKPDYRSSVPFIWMESQETLQRSPSASNRFPLFIRKIEGEHIKEGVFNCYGLSLNSDEIKSTVPEF